MKRPRDNNKMFACMDRRGSAHIRDTGKELALSSRLKSIYNNPQNIHARRAIAGPNPDDHSADAAGGSSPHWQSNVVFSDANNAAANESNRCGDATRRLESRAEVSESRAT